MRKHIPNILSIIAIIMTVTACNKLYDVSLANSANTKSQIEANEQQQYPRPSSVVEENAAYVDVTPVSLEQPPAWYNTRITLHGNKLPFNFYVTQILGNTGVLVNYDPSVDPNRLVSLDYTGTARGALNALANKGNYYFEYDRKAQQLDWSTLETKIFDVSFMPGSSQYQLGQSGSAGLSSSSGSSSSSSSSSSGSSSGSATGYDFTQDSQYSNLTGTVSVWDDLSKTIQNLLSKDGTVTISQSTTTVTVHDHPANVKAIGTYIYKMNEEMSRQVRIYVQVLAVALNKDFSEGINWNLVRLSGSNTFTLQSPTATNAAAGVASAATPMTLTWSAGAGSLWEGTDTFIQALQEQGTVSKITEPVVTTLNNQVATISLQTQQAYVSGTSGGTVSGNVASLPSPTISEIVTGFNLYLLPKIQGQSIYLQVSTVLSDLISLNTYNAATGQTNGGSGSSSSSSTASTASSTSSTTVIQTPQTVQEPTVDYRSFNQRTMIPNGATLIMAGFKQNTNRAEQSKLFNSAALGGTGASTDTQEVLVLITPVILSTTGNGSNSGKVN